MMVITLAQSLKVYLQSMQPSYLVEATAAYEATSHPNIVIKSKQECIRGLESLVLGAQTNQQHYSPKLGPESVRHATN